LTGGSLADYLDGGSGYDTLSGNADNDSLSGGLNGDVLWGGDGDDTLSGDGGNDALYGEQGNDSLSGGQGNDRLSGGRGNDILSGGNGEDTYLFSIGAGQDIINNYHADNKGDTIRFDVGLAYVTAIDRSGDDLIIHYGTDDQLTVSGQFSGGDYQIDRLSFMNYFDSPGPRHIAVDNISIGGDGDDNLVGTDANDLLVGGAGADSLAGGEGDDVYFVDNSADSVTEAELQGSDTVVSSVTYTLTGFTEKLTLLSGAADATGNALNNVLLGNTGANTLAGADGNDTLIGGEGADTLIGGLGKDILLLNESSSAADTVKIGVTDSLLGAFDTIQGFRQGEDKLDLPGSLIAADASSVDGVDVGHIQSHAIKNGIISFDNTDTFHHALSPYFTTVASMLEYLQLNLNNGETVAFGGPNYSSYVFQDHGAEDTVVQLTGVWASGLVADGSAEYGIWLS
jgi:Ca2+-binding RTX toxin-like protein